MAYWTAVYFFETKLVKKAILIVPTSPAAKLSRPTINDKSERFASRLATNAKNRLVTRTAAPPARSAVVSRRFLIKYPPTKKPAIDAARATVFTKAPISVLVKPISK